MQFIVLLLRGSFVFATTPRAQNFGPFTLTPITGFFLNPPATGTPQLTDLVVVNRLQPFGTAGLALSSFASTADVQNLNARIDQAFQQLQQSQQQQLQQFQRSITQVERGVAATTAMANV